MKHSHVDNTRYSQVTLYTRRADVECSPPYLRWVVGALLWLRSLLTSVRAPPRHSPPPPPPVMLLVLLLAAAARPCLQAEPSILSSLYGYDDCIGSVDNFDTQARHWWAIPRQ